MISLLPTRYDCDEKTVTLETGIVVVVTDDDNYILRNGDVVIAKTYRSSGDLFCDCCGGWCDHAVFYGEAAYIEEFGFEKRLAQMREYINKYDIEVLEKPHWDYPETCITGIAGRRGDFNRYILVTNPIGPGQSSGIVVTVYKFWTNHDVPPVLVCKVSIDDLHEDRFIGTCGDDCLHGILACKMLRYLIDFSKMEEEQKFGKFRNTRREDV